MNHEPNRFYVVLREHDNRLHRHATAEAATAEAERLARKETAGFYVLAALAKVRPTPPIPLEWVTTYEEPE